MPGLAQATWAVGSVLACIVGWLGADDTPPPFPPLALVNRPKMSSAFAALQGHMRPLGHQRVSEGPVPEYNEVTVHQPRRTTHL